MNRGALPLVLAVSAGAALAVVSPARPAVSRPRASATLRVVVRDLPPGSAARVTVSGPSGVHRRVARTTRLRLAAGRYLVTAAPVRGASFTAVPAVSRRIVVLADGGRSTTTVSYAHHVPDSAPPPVSAPGAAPAVTSVGGTEGTVGSYEVWLTVSFTDPECDVIGGTWSNAGEGMFDFGAWGRPDLMRNLACAGGSGTLQFARSCIAAGRFGERVRLTDAQGHRGADYAFTFSCA